MVGLKYCMASATSSFSQSVELNVSEIQSIKLVYFWPRNKRLAGHVQPVFTFCWSYCSASSQDRGSLIQDLKIF